jgi:probable F420-dependent oxidoreductase
VHIGLNVQNLPRDDIAVQVSEIAKGAEASGMHSIWVSEHIVLPAHPQTLDPYNQGGVLPFEIDTLYAEAMVLLGYIAASTTTLRLGTYVIPAIARDPLSLAKQASIVDVLSGGRLELGVGAGYLVEEAQLLGHPVDHRAGRLAETIEIMRKAWTKDVFEHSGRYWNLPLAAVRPAPIQGTLPVWIGGSSPTALRTASRHGNGVLVPKATPQSVAAARTGVPSSVRVGAGWHVKGTGADLDSAVALRDAGADLLIVHAGTDAKEVMLKLEYLAATVLPELDTDQASAMLSPTGN